VPLGASWSSKIRAIDFTPGGTFSILRGGFTFSPSQPYFLGIVPLGSNAGLDTLKSPALVASRLNALETVRRKRTDRQEIPKRFMVFLHTNGLDLTFEL
jgi:hypothetical protein